MGREVPQMTLEEVRSGGYIAGHQVARGAFGLDVHGEHGLVRVVVDCRGTGDVDGDSHRVVLFVADALSIHCSLG